MKRTKTFILLALATGIIGWWILAFLEDHYYALKPALEKARSRSESNKRTQSAEGAQPKPIAPLTSP